MYSRFPLSMENIPRQSGFGCFSLRFGTVLTALVVILYSLLGLSQGGTELLSASSNLDINRWEMLMTFTLILCVTIIHAVTFILSNFMLIGALRDKSELVRPWIIWMSTQLLASVCLFILFNTLSMLHQFNDTSLLYCAVEFLSILIRFYMLVLVTSFYKQLIEERGETEKLRNLINMGDTWYTDA